MCLSVVEKDAIFWCYNIAMAFADEETGDIILQNDSGEKFSLKGIIEGLLGDFINE